MFGLVTEHLHSQERAQAAEACGKEEESLFGYPPFTLSGLGFIGSVKGKGDDGHYCVKHKKNSHTYIIIVEMRFSNRSYSDISKAAAAVLCLAVLLAQSGCNSLAGGSSGGNSSGSGESVTGSAPQDTGISVSVSEQTESDVVYENAKKAYVYNVWYDIEKDNPVDYDSIDSNDAYALKCVFYFNKPVSGDFRAVLNRDGKPVAETDIRIDGKVVCECDFSAGLEGVGTFEAGVYCVSLETGGKTVAVSVEMRVS